MFNPRTVELSLSFNRRFHLKNSTECLAQIGCHVIPGGYDDYNGEVTFSANIFKGSQNRTQELHFTRQEFYNFSG